jgi:hypothetical protein
MEATSQMKTLWPVTIRILRVLSVDCRGTQLRVHIHPFFFKLVPQAPRAWRLIPGHVETHIKVQLMRELRGSTGLCDPAWKPSMQDVLKLNAVSFTMHVAVLKGDAPVLIPL